MLWTQLNCFTLQTPPKIQTTLSLMTLKAAMTSSFSAYRWRCVLYCPKCQHPVPPAATLHIAAACGCYTRADGAFGPDCFLEAAIPRADPSLPGYPSLWRLEPTKFLANHWIDPHASSCVISLLCTLPVLSESGSASPRSTATESAQCLTTWGEGPRLCYSLQEAKKQQILLHCGRGTPIDAGIS